MIGPNPPRRKVMYEPTCVELCAGGGGQAIGLEDAGFQHPALVEVDEDCCVTLNRNRQTWNVIAGDIKEFDGSPYCGVDLLAAGLPCPPFSVAGRQLGQDDERDLFPAALRLVEQMMPSAVMIENVRGILSSTFEDYRGINLNRFEQLGYRAEWKLFNASQFGVPQLRPRAILVAVRSEISENFDWPVAPDEMPPTVGEALFTQMSSRGWEHAEKWRDQADKIAPTGVGGSKRHGGPDLGPVRAKRAWKALGVDGHGIANDPPPAKFVGLPRLTVPMVARLQGFPSNWSFFGGKTTAYRQVGNTFPPPVARAVGEQIKIALAAN